MSERGETALTELQIDALREVANIGAGNAALSFSQLTGLDLRLELPSTDAIRAEHLPDLLGDPEQVWAAVYIPFHGEVSGRLLVLIRDEHARLLLGRLGLPVGDWSELTEAHLSALAETANIAGSNYLAALLGFTGLVMFPDPPMACVDMAAAIMGSVAAEVGLAQEECTVLGVELHRAPEDGSGEAFRMLLLLLPDADALTAILERLGLEEL